MEIQTHEVSVSDIAVATVRELQERGFRKANTLTLLFCHLPSIRHASLIVCAPIDSYLCALQEYPAFFNALHKYTSSDLIPSSDFYANFLGEMKRAGLSRDFVPTPLFEPYARWGAYTAQMKPPFGKKFPGLDFERRTLSALIPEGSVARVTSYMHQLFSQASGSATAPASEALLAITSRNGFSEIPERSAVHYESPDFDALAVNVFNDEGREDSAMNRLAEIWCSLKRDEDPQIRLFPLHLVKVAPSVYVRKDAPFPSSEWERATLRSKILEKLGWLWHYPSAIGQLVNLREMLSHVSGTHRLALEEIVETVANYCRLMESRYPVIAANPLA